MADLGFDGMIKVSWVTTIANIGAPTVAELNAGVSLEGRLTADGLTISADTADVDTSKLNSTANSAKAGRRTFTLGVKYVRGDSADTAATAVETALVWGADGYLVVRRDIESSQAWAASQLVEVYPAECGEKNPDSPAPNAQQAVAVPMKNTAAPRSLSNRATVAL
jgi:hypothetical protein